MILRSLRAARRLRIAARLRAASAALLVAAAAGTVTAPAASAAAKIDARERAVIVRINAVRAQHGLGPLALKSGLSRVADRHSGRLHRHGVLSHQLPGEGSVGARLAPVARVKPIGEVVFGASGAGSAQIVRAWMDSPGHRQLLLSGSFKAAGIGIHSGARGLFATVDLAGR